MGKNTKPRKYCSLIYNKRRIWSELVRLKAATDFSGGHCKKINTDGKKYQSFSFIGIRGKLMQTEQLAAGGLHLYLLEEGSCFALDNWLQQRASPLAGGGTLWQVLTSMLHYEPLSPPPPALSSFSPTHSLSDDGPSGEIYFLKKKNMPGKSPEPWAVFSQDVA